MWRADPASEDQSSCPSVSARNPPAWPRFATCSAARERRPQSNANLSIFPLMIMSRLWLVRERTGSSCPPKVKNDTDLPRFAASRACVRTMAVVITYSVHAICPVSLSRMMTDNIAFAVAVCAVLPHRPCLFMRARNAALPLTAIDLPCGI
ncbi:hypothetical protein ABW21_db0204212 [Orbilia brochopaga]|nr:hypothetical protein ABW21_db0204212 [Drechslerella brochopaga]